MSWHVIDDPLNDYGYYDADSSASRHIQSSEGRAALPMSILDNEDAWIEIQKNTFTNWVNEQLKANNMGVEDLQYDFMDGLRLVALVEILQKRRIGRIVRRPLNQHQFLENLNIALKAITDEDIKLVNIGSLHLILCLILLSTQYGVVVIVLQLNRVTKVFKGYISVLSFSVSFIHSFLNVALS